MGWNYGTISASYAKGKVSGTDDDAGGLVGQNQGGTIRASYATGAVTGEENIGGLVGVNINAGVSFNAPAGTIIASYARGTVEGTSNVGGLVGLTSGTVTRQLLGYRDLRRGRGHRER